MKTEGHALCSACYVEAQHFLFLLLGWVVQDSLLFGGYVNYEVHHAVALAKYIVIPGSELYKVVAATSVNPTIKGERESIAIKFPGHNLVLMIDAL